MAPTTNDVRVLPKDSQRALLDVADELWDHGRSSKAVWRRTLATRIRGAVYAAPRVEPTELPKVRNERGMQRFEAGASYADWDDDPEYFEERAREYLALALRLRQERETSAADEAQVNQMLEDISVVYSSESGVPCAKVVARRLVERGWTKPGVES